MKKGLKSDVVEHIGKRMRDEIGILNLRRKKLYDIAGQVVYGSEPAPVMDEIRRIEQKIDVLAEHFGLKFETKPAQPEKLEVIEK